MNYNEMERNGTLDYYLDLKKYIQEFVDRKYPLSKEDLSATLGNTPTENLLKRQETTKILEEAMKESLESIANRNEQIIEGANNGNYTEFSVQDYRQEVEQIKQEMLEKLWEAEHQEKPIQGQNTEGQTVQTNEQDGKTIQTYGEQEQANGQEEQNGEDREEEQNPQMDVSDGEKIVNEAIEESERIGIRADEISQSNREINQTEIAYVQEQTQEQPQMDVGMSIGE